MAVLGSMPIGSIVKMKVSGIDHDFIVVNQGKPSALYDESCNGTWVLMKDVYLNMKWSSSDNSYRNSNVHSYLNNTFYNLFETDIKNAIKTVKIPYHNSVGNSGSVSSGSNGLSCNVFLLSGCEIGWVNIEPFDGARLSYFKLTSSRDDERMANYNGSIAPWWLRSPTKYSSTEVYVITTSGDRGSDCGYQCAWGVRPALVLPSTLCVDRSGYIGFNAEPTISGSSSSGSDLGEISAPSDLTYTVNDMDGDTVTVKEYLDDVLTRTYTAALDEENTFEALRDPVQFQKILNGSHTVKIIADDGQAGESLPYIVTFNKQVRQAVITLNDPLPADDAIRAAVISITGKIPYDAGLEVLVTNNALDENPVWEDMSREVRQSVNHVFENKTAANGFAFNFKVTATRGGSEEQGFIANIGGAFE